MQTNNQSQLFCTEPYMHTNDKPMSTVLSVKAIQGSEPSTQEAGAQGQPVYAWISEARDKGGPPQYNNIKMKITKHHV